MDSDSDHKRTVVSHLSFVEQRYRLRKVSRKHQTRKDSATAPETQVPLEPIGTPTAPLTWAQRLKRVFDIDITLCPLCGGRLRVIADITEPELITKILDHIQNRDPPRQAPRRALPHSEPNDLFAER